MNKKLSQLTMRDLGDLFIRRNDGKYQSRPYVDWRFLVIATVVVTLLVGILHYCIFWRSTHQTPAEETGTPQTLNVDRLNKVVERIDAQTEAFNILLEIPSTVPSPF